MAYTESEPSWVVATSGVDADSPEIDVELELQPAHRAEALDVLGYVLSTNKLSRRVYGPLISAQDFMEFKLEFENKLATKQLKESNIASNLSEGSGAADRQLCG